MLLDVQPADPQPIAHNEKRPTPGSFREYAESLLVTILIVLFGTTFIVQTFKIPSGSMEKTLLVGDYLLVNKFIFEGRGHSYEKFLPYRDIRRGDVIVFKFPFDDHPHYVKRAIGLPGDRIRISDSKVYVNGEQLDEPYVIHDPPYADRFGDDFPPVSPTQLSRLTRPEWADEIFSHIVHGELIVPPDEYFAMGDNRDHSLDSRYWGFVRRDAIMGRPVVIYWSIRGPEDDVTGLAPTETPSLFFTLRHLPSLVRWHRLLHEVH
jgi:signal peptidase I